ncbi:hypothetical protein BDB00DRAFT_870084 [Zychaea mexicana]|uniref:uncharacterized protein n=1 Tax=Zychaea mexicana TaxID=64656 RepID=UPI0022FDF53B|nr:uncharacterized protein BDB00DRAFT_870084 [Zychaea mexicana]KAI9495863.1 hypothetical protein BDB00DRAFT_870084 [Zychaea mexicana]
MSGSGRGLGAKIDQQPPQRPKRQRQQQQQPLRAQKQKRQRVGGNDFDDINGSNINTRGISADNGSKRSRPTRARGRSRSAAATRLEQQQQRQLSQFLMDQLDLLMLMFLIERFYQQQVQRCNLFLPVLNRVLNQYQQVQRPQDNGTNHSLQHVERQQENQPSSSCSAQQQQTVDALRAIPSLSLLSSTVNRVESQQEEQSDGISQRIQPISTLDDLIVYWLVLDWDNRQVLRTAQENEQQQQQP